MECTDFLNKCCALDLESNEKNDVFAIAALCQDSIFQFKAPFNISDILKQLDTFAGKAEFLLGHNLLGHDIPVCRAINPQSNFVNKAIVDTLYLSPLAFPENPYHRLVKNYKLVRDGLSNPLLDAKLALSLFSEQWQALSQHKEMISFYHFAFSEQRQFTGLHLAFAAMGAETLSVKQAKSMFTQITQDRVCVTALKRVLANYMTDIQMRPALAYALAWLGVADGNSVLPAWVFHEFKNVAPLLRQLRDIACQDKQCNYCQHIHNPEHQLQLYFGFAEFRAQPATGDGGSLQRQIVQAGMCEQPLFAILPTGGGKSLCFQIPALVRYQRRGVLTIVVSPLQALMKDQVDNLANKTGAPNAAALYGMLTSPERGEVLNGVRMGDIALLYVSPEQLRNRSFQNAIANREIGCWVFDEAHCLSKWGHDFRPDYLYAARFIKELSIKQNKLLPPVQCFTATAKQDVKDEIIDYFQRNLAQSLTIFEGGVERTNLQFDVQTINQADKYPRIHALLQEHLGQETDAGSAIIYCSTRKGTEEVAEYLQQQGWQVDAFHAGKNNAEKKHIQENFIKGINRIITATNAFGMGIDKEDVRLVIHADIPGSLENYLQEAGRAGRDRQQAVCILLYDEQDIETQFKLSANSKLSQRDIAQILKGLRNSKKDRDGNVVLTAGELLMVDKVNTSFDNEDRQAATKVVTAISWLERAGYVQRNQNNTQVFQGRPLVKDMQQARKKLDKLDLSQRQKLRWLAILDALFNAASDEGFSADDLAHLGEFSSCVDDVDKKAQTASQRVIRTLYDMTEAGLIEKNLLLTAFVRYKRKNSAQKILPLVCSLERAMIETLQEQAPDSENTGWQNLSLRHLNQAMLDQGFKQSNPEQLRKMLTSLSKDGQGLAGRRGSINIRHQGLDQYAIKLQRDWKALTATALLRQAIAKVVLQGILGKKTPGTIPNNEVLLEFSLEDLLLALKADLVTSTQLKDPLAAVERALNFLHEQNIITLQKGLAVFRQAMTIQVLPEAKNRRYNKGDYQPLAQHYSERTFQVHVINEYAQQALQKIGQALAFVMAYFSQDKSEFVQRYFADREEIYQRATSQQSFQRIVSDLHNPEQIAIVAAQEQDNQLILAGPGAGKTRVVVHRCAYLLRVQRVSARSMLVLCFNRNAANELRRRLFDLVGADSKGVTIQTYHGFSLRLCGYELNPEHLENKQDYFVHIIKQAIALLRGETELLGIDADSTRAHLLAGYRHILVDEYQDIDALQYELISAISGRTLEGENKLSILAVGDDDQNIYQFRGANIVYIRQFQQDYQAQQRFLVENYRSSAHIISAANQLIANNQDRMKIAQPIRINQDRKGLPAGGRWQQLDPLVNGRVHIINVDNPPQQAAAVCRELFRLQQLDARLEWDNCAILAREWHILSSVRGFMDAQHIPYSLQLPSGKQPPVFRIREVVLLLDSLKTHAQSLSNTRYWLNFILQHKQYQADNPWWQLLLSLLKDWQQETGDAEVPIEQIRQYLYEVLAEQRQLRRLGKGIFLSTVHACKGMEFDHVLLLDGGWTQTKSEEQRRLYYVAMTRAKETLTLMQCADLKNIFIGAMQGDFILRRQVATVSVTQQKAEKINYLILGLQDIQISYPARFPASHIIHKQLNKLSPGSLLTMHNQSGKTLLKDQLITVAQLSQHAHVEWVDRLDSIISVRVIAMIRRYRDDNEESFRARCQLEQWEVPLLEVKFVV